jgi:hypothetical protein
MTSESWFIVLVISSVVGLLVVVPIAAYLISKMATFGFLKAKKSYEDEEAKENISKNHQPKKRIGL